MTFVGIISIVATWAISGIITVTYMKARNEVILTYMKEKLLAIDRHLENADSRHEQLLRDFTEHRIEMAKKVH